MARLRKKKKGPGAAQWNKLLSELQRGTPLSGENVVGVIDQAQRVGLGGELASFVNVHRRKKQRHPWEIIPYWDGTIPVNRKAAGRDFGAWCLKVVPGFVNGLEPAISMLTEFLPEDAKVYGNKYGQTGAFKNRNAIDVLITDEPTPFFTNLSVINANERGLVQSGSSDDLAAPIPPFFRYQGARAPDPLDPISAFLNSVIAKDAAQPGDFFTPGAGTQELLDFLAGIFQPEITLKGETLPSGNRELFSCDVVLQVDRIGLQTNMITDSFGIPRLDGFNLVEPTKRYHARLYQVGHFDPFLYKATQLDKLLGTYFEPTFEQILIGRVWFLSPDNPSQIFTPEDTNNEFTLGHLVLDDSWTPFVENKVFWNLNFASVNNVDVSPVGGILPAEEALVALLAVLGGGVGFVPAAAIVEEHELALATLQQALNTTTLTGLFWTG